MTILKFYNLIVIFLFKNQAEEESNDFEYPEIEYEDFKNELDVNKELNIDFKDSVYSIIEKLRKNNKEEKLCKLLCYYAFI